MAQMNIDGYSADEVTKALEDLEKKRTRQATEKERRNTPAFKEEQALRNKRRRVHQQLLQQKALEAGITVTDEELDVAIAAKE